MKSAIASVAGVAALVYCAYRLYRRLRRFFASRKQRLGRRGEAIVASRLREGLPSEYIIINRLYLPLSSGGTTEIDHVVVSEYGIFVIETKTCSGRLHCSPQAKNWRQVLTGRHTRMPNPLWQNAYHVKVLSSRLWLPQDLFKSIVAITGEGDMVGDIPHNMMYSRKVADYILGFERRIIPKERVLLIAKAIEEWKSLMDEDAPLKHIAYIRGKKKRTKENSPEGVALEGQNLV